jgi:2-amino-4-hydroxy-6-hydroxymethyldihydropteridine diphosphokinase
VRAYLGLGSNLGSSHGDPAATVQAAVVAIEAEVGSAGSRRSRVYRTAALGPPQPDYANAVISLETSIGADQLLAAMLRIETRFGRTRGERFAPRTLDIDLLLFGGEVRGEGALFLPHPRLHERRFVLVPLVEIAPDLVHPTLGRTMAELLLDCPDRLRVELWERATPALAGARPGEGRS